MPVVTRLQRALTGQGFDKTTVAAHDTIDLDNITFHPELLVQWDNEADYGAHTACARPGRIATRPAQRSATR